MKSKLFLILFFGLIFCISCVSAVDISVNELDTISSIKEVDNNNDIVDFSFNSVNIDEAGDVVLDVSKLKTKIIASDLNVTVGDSKNFTVKLVDANENPIKSKNLIINYNGQNHTGLTDDSGTVSLGFSNLLSGSYNVSVSYCGDADYDSCFASIIVPVFYSSSKIYCLDDIINASLFVKNFVNNNKKLPSNVLVNNENISISEFTYLMGKAIFNIYSSDFSNLNSSMNYSCLNHDFFSCNEDLSSNSYCNLAQSLVLFMDLYYYTPNILRNVGFDCYSYTFSKILTFYNITHHLPLEINFNSNFSYDSNSLSISKSNSSQFISGCNEINHLNNVSDYLVNVSGSFSEITSDILKVGQALTNVFSSDWDKANALFNFVRDNIGYLPYDSSKGASVALNSKEANYNDKSNLLIALFRSVGLPARYCHATCEFRAFTGSHTWVQVLVDGVWYSADATNQRNTLGNILSWKINSMKDFTQYDLLPF